MSTLNILLLVLSVFYAACLFIVATQRDNARFRCGELQRRNDVYQRIIMKHERKRDRS